MPTAAGGQLHRHDPAGASAALGPGTAGRDSSSLWRGGKREPQWSPRPGKGPGPRPSPDPRSRQPLPQSGDTHGHTTPSGEPRAPSGPAAVRYLVRLPSANLHRRPSAPGAAILRPAPRPRPRPPIGCPPLPLPARASMAEALRQATRSPPRRTGGSSSPCRAGGPAPCGAGAASLRGHSSAAGSVKPAKPLEICTEARSCMFVLESVCFPK